MRHARGGLGIGKTKGKSRTDSHEVVRAAWIISSIAYPWGRNNTSLRPPSYSLPSMSLFLFAEGQSALKVSSESVKVSDSAPSESTVKQDDSSGKAISILEFVNTVNAICGVIIVIGCLVLGFATDQVAIGIGAALGWALVTVVLWAINQVFIGIAKDVRTIRLSN